MTSNTCHEWLIDGQEPSPPCTLSDDELRVLGESLMKQIVPRSREEMAAIFLGAVAK